MIILFEGLDGLGKTTLIKNFCDLSHMRVFNNPMIPPKSGTFNQGFNNGLYFGAYEAARLSDQDVIFDRSHITEMVYSKIKRGYEPHEEFWLDWEEHNKHWIVVVYLDGPIDLIKERFKQKKEDYLIPDDIEPIAKKYEEYFKKSKLSMIYIEAKWDRQRMLSQLVIQLRNLGFWTVSRGR